MPLMGEKMQTKKHKQHGGALLTAVFLIPVLLIGSALAYFGFCEARKAYWDHRVKEMCEKDAGVKIYETVLLSKKQYEQFGRVAGYVSIPVRNLAKDEIVISDSKDSYIRETQPTVLKTEVLIKNRETQKILAQYSLYSRVGGDFPSIAHPSSYSCPASISVYRSLEKIFLVKGE